MNSLPLSYLKPNTYTRQRIKWWQQGRSGGSSKGEPAVDLAAITAEAMTTALLAATAIDLTNFHWVVCVDFCLA